MKLLLVEDSSLVAERLCSALAAIPGLSLMTAGRAAAALDCFRAWQPDAVILDIELPDGNGLDLLRTIKRERSATLVLMFSNQESYRSHCKKEGADAFFDKAADFENLTDLVRHKAEASRGTDGTSGNS